MGVRNRSITGLNFKKDECELIMSIRKTVASAPYAYEFPRYPASPQSIEFHLSRLNALIKEEKLLGYGLIRDEFVSVNLAMNLDRKVAPAFRPAMRAKPKVSGAAMGSDAKLMVRDRIIIDLHWLSLTQQQPTFRDAEFSGMFTCGFDFETAEEFACQNWTLTHRAEQALPLIEFEMAQLDALVTTEFLQRRALIHDGKLSDGSKRLPLKSLLRATIRSAAGADSRLGQSIESYVDLGVARALMPLGTLKQLSEVLSLMRGSKRESESTIARRCERLDRYLDRFGGVHGWVKNGFGLMYEFH